jgi:hypothetical protein
MPHRKLTLGLVLYEIFTGKRLFNAKTIPDFALAPEPRRALPGHRAGPVSLQKPRWMWRAPNQ